MKISDTFLSPSFSSSVLVIFGKNRPDIAVEKLTFVDEIFAAIDYTATIAVPQTLPRITWSVLLYRLSIIIFKNTQNE